MKPNGFIGNGGIGGETGDGPQVLASLGQHQTGQFLLASRTVG
jgi:hypothetical protein